MENVEEKLIGCILIDNSSIRKVAEELKPEHFASPALGSVYRRCLELYATDRSIEPLTILETVEPDYKQRLFDILKKCSASAAVSVRITDYQEIILRRYTEKVFRDILAKKRGNDIYETLNQVMLELENLKAKKKKRAHTLKEIYEANKEKFFNPDYDPQRIYFGINSVDELIDGLEKGDVLVIGARPGGGKSAMAAQIAINLSKQKKRKVALYTQEMEEFQVYRRMLAHESGISLKRLRNAKEYENISEEIRFNKTVESMNNYNLIINDSGGITAGQIRNECKYITNLGLIIIDYLQLMRSENKYYSGNRNAEVGDISKSVKELAKELGVPIILLSQLNRASAARADTEPTMAELRESGDIEQDASSIVLMWSIQLEDEYDTRDIKGIKVEKNRDGIKGRTALEFVGSTMTFRETDYKIKKPSTNFYKKSYKEDNHTGYEPAPF